VTKIESLKSIEAYSRNDSMPKSILAARINRKYHKSCENNEIIENSILSLYRYVKKNGWEGYDPYDGLNSKFTSRISRRSKWIRVFFVQLNKSLPLNIRGILRIKKGIHIKGMGLFASAFLKLFRKVGDIDFLEEAVFCLDFLKKKSLKGNYSGHCWGDYFEYQPAKGTLMANTTNTPDIINTVVCASAFLDHYKITGSKESLAIAESSRNFIVDTLYVNNNEKAFFKYTPTSETSAITYNASTHGAAFLSRINMYVEDKKSSEIATKVMDHIISKQKPNGAWYYSESDGREVMQIDFHQGFIMDDLYCFIKHTQSANGKYMKALLKGAEFYRNEQFLPDGRAKWRWPAVYPIDIHNQAQGIITFSKLSKIKDEYFDFAEKIASWTITNMQNERGEFYYRKGRYLTNRIPYMRWAQAWMMLALGTLLEVTNNRNSVLNQA
jgi:Txe/YoeB family toxin of Txe-Axe toxin-antitoxin module